MLRVVAVMDEELGKHFALDRTPRNCAACRVQSNRSGAGVAVAQSSWGVAPKALSSVCRVSFAWCLIMPDSSSTTPPEARNVKLAAGRNS